MTTQSYHYVHWSELRWFGLIARSPDLAMHFFRVPCKVAEQGTEGGKSWEIASVNRQAWD